MSASPDATTLLLNYRRSGGGSETIAALFPLVYDELHRLARARLRRQRNDHTLDTAALVHEAFLKLVDQTHLDWQDEMHFCAIASRCMRDILVDYARHRNAAKRGGGQRKLTLDGEAAAHIDQTETLLAVNDALDKLMAHNERMGRIVECRFFGGLSMEETAAALGTSKRTAEREWTRAKAYLGYLMKA